MTRRLVLPTVGALAAAIAAAGCGGSGESEPVATNDVTMAKSYRFEPKAIEVRAGDAVTWTNDDNFTHTVRVDGQDDHEVGRGDSVSIRSTSRARTTTSARCTGTTWTATVIVR